MRAFLKFLLKFLRKLFSIWSRKSTTIPTEPRRDKPVDPKPPPEGKRDYDSDV